MNNMRAIFKGTALAVGFLALLSCNPLENKTDSSSMLFIESLKGVNTEGDEVDYLESDVVTLDEVGNATVFEDGAVATIGAKLLDPNPIAGPSQYNDVLLTRYIVRYSRSDGRNREGIDVPYAFEGALSTLIKVDSTTDVSFVLVRAAAKLEPPLVNLAAGRDAGELQVTATVEFFGHDLMNKSVKVTGTIAVFFADWADNN